MSTLLFVVYDGIKNSIFQSQVVSPLLEELTLNKDLDVKVVCFEIDIISAQNFSKTLNLDDRIEFIFLKRYPFFGRSSLCYAKKHFKKLLQRITPDKIITRGPLAGEIVLDVLPHYKIQNILVQARGLCAQEFRYVTKDTTNLLRKLWNKFIFNNFDKIERKVYTTQGLKIEAVSPALKDYLIEYFGAEPANIFIAVKDIPKSVDKYQATVWRGQVRDELEIPDEAIVYCYSGSFKPWQCATQTIETFAFEYFKNSNTFMLILTQDIAKFEHELIKFKLPKTNYKVLFVNSQMINKYLCAANYGILLREPDIINFVSRPTKMLEYQSCGLKIIHNNTIAWLSK